MKKPELLAPAGDFECLKSAVFGGANAVYFGAKNFNARAKANNFGEDMAKAVAFCHMYGVKAYLTLNILLENNQTDELIQTVKHALSCGIDAFIVQDFGILHILKNNFKYIEIHASTQMAVNNYQGAIMAEKMGIKRVVLSRETTIEDIKLIKEKTNLEIEYFIQGALCVCVSGNCYLSSHLFGKSGNKGECIQPCRLPYKATYGDKVIKKGYLLSAKDLCLANRLKELEDAGVDSFKIEGRLRRPAYVSAVVKTYREILDSKYKVSQQNIKNIKMAFNRGDFVEGYLQGNHNIIDSQIQGHKGIAIGNVISFKKGNKFNVITLKSSHNIIKGDVLKFIKDGNEVGLITAMDISTQNNTYQITTTQTIPAQSTANLILNFLKEHQDTQEIKRLPVNFTLNAYVGKRVELEYQFKEINGSVLGEIFQMAKTQSLTKQEAFTQLSKLKDTYFELNNFAFNSNGVFITKKELNNLRRNAINQIENHYQSKSQVEFRSINNKLEIKPFLKQNNCQTLEISDNTSSNSDILVLKPKDYLNYNYCDVKHKNVYLYVPCFLRSEDIKVIDKILNENESFGVYAENIGALCYNRKTILGAKLNIKNIFAIKELVNKNTRAIVLSPENTQSNLKFFTNISKNIPLFIANFNGFDLMTLVHCPIKCIHNNNCDKCMYKDGIKYQMDGGHKLELTRYKVRNCYFNLSKFVDNKNSILYNRLQER